MDQSVDDMKKDTMYYNVTLRRVRVTIVAMSSIIYSEGVCVPLSYLVCKVHASYCTVICSLSGYTFFHIIS
jgi:hypothetical protein